MTNQSRLIGPIAGAVLVAGGAWPAAAAVPERPTMPIFSVDRAGIVENSTGAGPSRRAKLDEVRAVLTVPAGGTFKSIDGVVHEWRSARRNGCAVTVRAAAFAAASGPVVRRGRATVFGHRLPAGPHGTAKVPFLNASRRATGSVVVHWYLAPASSSTAGQALGEFKLPTGAAPHAKHRFIYLAAGVTPNPDKPDCRSATRSQRATLSRSVARTFTGAATK